MVGVSVQSVACKHVGVWTQKTVKKKRKMQRKKEKCKEKKKKRKKNLLNINLGCRWWGGGHGRTDALCADTDRLADECKESKK